MNFFCTTIIKYGLLIWVVSVLGVPSSSWSFYLIPGADFTLEDDQPTVSEDLRSGYFGLKENAFDCKRKDKNGFLLLPALNHVIYADLIKANVPVFSMFRYPPLSEDVALANILSGHLKLKKLLEEYEEVKRRANGLLLPGDSASAMGRVDIGSGYMENSLEHSNGKDATQESSIEQIVEGLRQELAAVNIVNFSSHLAAPAKSSAIADERGDTSILLTFTDLQQQTKVLSYGLPDSSSKIAEVNRRAESTYSSSCQNNLRIGSQGQRQQAVQKTNSGSSAVDISLPWILELPFKLYDYFMRHKIVATCIFLFFLLLLNLIFSARTK